MAERPLGFAAGADEDLGPDVRAVDHGRQGHRLLRAQGVREPFEDAGELASLAHQSSASMNRWIVPPHVSPTANASSSE